MTRFRTTEKSSACGQRDAASLVGTWLLLLATLLLVGAVAAQETPGDEEPVDPQTSSSEEEPGEPEPTDFDDPLTITVPVLLEGGSTGEQLEIVIHRWTGVLPPFSEEGRVPAQDDEAVEAEPQHFVVSVAEQPIFIKNISWIDGPELVYEPGESSKTVTLVFDTAAEGESGLPEEEAELVLHVEARDETVEPNPREVVVPLLFKRALVPGESTVTVCALRGDAPDDFPIEEAFQYCDPDRVPVLRYDRIVVFFTPARDLREPIGEAQYFAMQILGPHGDRVGGATFWNEGSVEEPVLSMPFTVEGSPGRFAVPLELWDLRDDPDPTRASKGPGTYTVQTAGVRVEGGSAVFGQGEGSPVIDGEWQDDGTFEIGDREFEFKTFVTELAGVLDFPYNPSLRLGKVTYGEPQVDGTRVVIDLSAEWRWHAKEAERASSRLLFEFPERLLPGFETAGDMTASLERLAGGEGDDAFVFTAGVHDPVATTTRPPRRALAGSEAPIWTATRKDEIGRRHDTADGSRCDGEWIWTQGEPSSYDRRELTSGSCTFSFLGIRTARDAWGEPARDLASHLHDPESLLVIPVFYAVRGKTGADLGVKGYAIYGVAQEPYDGPPPAEKPEGGIGPAAPPVLKLTQIVGDETGEGSEYVAGNPGITGRSESRFLDGSPNISLTESARLVGLPLEIRLGEKFTVGADAVRSVAFGPDVECAIVDGASARLTTSTLGGEFSAVGAAGRSRCSPDDGDASRFFGDPRPDGGGSASMALELTPVRGHERSLTEVDFLYRAAAATPGDVEGPGEQEGVLFTWDYARQTTPDGYLVPDAGSTTSSRLWVRVSSNVAGSVTAYYEPVESPDDGLASVPPYEHPVIASTTPPAGRPPGEEDVPPVPVGEPEVVATADADQELVPPGATGVRDGFDPDDPNTWDPDKDPDVANHIRTWLRVAEPPESAVPGVDFDYDELGRKIGGGGATGRVISRHDSVDYNTGATPEATVWAELRSLLDSIDHCTLEEYVVAKVQGGSIDHCRGRYGAVRDLGGVPLAEAKAEVQGGGFQVRLAPGSPAPSPELDGAVEGQDPPPSQYLRRGQTLRLTVYSPYVAEVTVPDLVGLSRSEAKGRLEDDGLLVVLRPGAPARSPAESDTIENQEPEAGTVLEPGAEVAIWVRPAFVAAATIPDLVGLSTGEARAALAEVGIDGILIDLRPGSPAPSPALAGRVEAQEPAAGWTVEPGTRVRLTVHSGFVDLRTVPSVIGLSSGEAKRRLAALGLEVRLAPGTPAPSPNAEGTVQSQSPNQGSSVSTDSVVTLTIHSPWVPPPTAVPPPPTAVPPPVFPTVVTGAGGGELPLPDLRCPDFVTLSFSRDLCIYDPSLRPPAGARLPLDRQRSGHEEGSSREWGTYVFRCYYSFGNHYTEFISIWWSHSGSPRSQYSGCGGREGERFGGTYGFFSPTHIVEAKLNGNCFDAREYEAVARSLIRQTEPFAKSCTGAVVQPPAPMPPTPTNTPVPPPAVPPACPGPGAPAIYTLFDPPPYAGRSTVCRDGSGKMWINISNNVYPVTGIQQGSKDPNSECWWGSTVVIPGRTLGGTLCR